MFLSKHSTIYLPYDYGGAMLGWWGNGMAACGVAGSVGTVGQTLEDNDE